MRLVYYTVQKSLKLMNICFEKNISMIFTYESGHAETTIGGMEKELKMSTDFGVGVGY